MRQQTVEAVKTAPVSQRNREEEPVLPHVNEDRARRCLAKNAESYPLENAKSLEKDGWRSAKVTVNYGGLIETARSDATRSLDLKWSADHAHHSPLATAGGARVRLDLNRRL